jgi:hypothetical protein
MLDVPYRREKGERAPGKFSKARIFMSIHRSAPDRKYIRESAYSALLLCAAK